MKIVEGDLVKMAWNGEFDVILHGCNCMGVMGAGIAKQIAQQFPEVLTADRMTGLRDKDKLGEILPVMVNDKYYEPFFVVNIYSQYDYRGPKNIDYEALAHGFNKVRKLFKGSRIGMPWIGCGLAGGHQETVRKMIEEYFKGFDITLVEYGGK